MRRLRWWYRWYLTERGASASLLYHDAKGTGLSLTKGQAYTLARRRETRR